MARRQRRLQEDGSYWDPATNEARSRTLRGRQLDLKTRAKYHATKRTGRREWENDPEWQRLYTERLQQLRLKRWLLNNLPQRSKNRPEPGGEHPPSQLRKLIRSSTRQYIDFDAFQQQMQSEFLQPQTLTSLYDWLDISEEERERISSDESLDPAPPPPSAANPASPASSASAANPPAGLGGGDQAASGQ
jgi:hypothetical protein